MSKLFGRKKSSRSPKEAGISSQFPLSAEPVPSPKSSRGGNTLPSGSHIFATGVTSDDFGRSVSRGASRAETLNGNGSVHGSGGGVPAYSTSSLSTGTYGGAPKLPEKDKKKDGGRMRSSSLGSYAGQEEMALIYGYWGIETELELSPNQVEQIITVIGEEIKTRGMDQPQIFSTMALDITQEGVTALIRAYVHDPTNTWLSDIRFANPHDLAGMLKWALARVVVPPYLRQVQKASGGRGFLSWDVYDSWRRRERDTGFNPRYLSTHLIHYLDSQCGALLAALLGLLASVAAYSATNGMTPRKLAALFSSYIFGLPDDAPFETTYNAFLRYSHATEHMLLAFIRDMKDKSGRVPTRLEDFIGDYPRCIETDFNQPSKASKLAKVWRMRKTTRFYSKNLIATSGQWKVPNSEAWRFLTPPPSTARPTETTFMTSVSPAPPQGAVPTAIYRHLLNFRTDDEDDLDATELQRYKTVTEKEWGSFMDKGFEMPDEKKFAFDLRESERTGRKQKHTTMDWSQFANSGFGGRETYLDTDLEFTPNFNDSVSSWPQQKTELNQRLRKVEKALPPFPYNTEPREESAVLVDELFFEAWADVLVSSGWSRDEMKESSWALVQWKSWLSEYKSEDRWFLMEEEVPKEYRHDFLEGKPTKKSSKRISFLRPLRIKPKKDNESMQGGGRFIDDSVFAPGTGGDTRMLSLSRDRTTSTYSAAQSAYTAAPTGYAPTTIAEEDEEDDQLRDARNRRGIGGTLSSQKSGFGRLSVKRLNNKKAQATPFSYDTRSVDALDGPQGERPGHRRGESKDDSWVDVMVREDPRSDYYRGPQTAPLQSSSDDNLHRAQHRQVDNDRYHDSHQNGYTAPPALQVQNEDDESGYPIEPSEAGAEYDAQNDARSDVRSQRSGRSGQQPLNGQGRASPRSPRSDDDGEDPYGGIDSPETAHEERFIRPHGEQLTSVPEDDRSPTPTQTTPNQSPDRLHVQTRQIPQRRESLPESPKPDADVPTDASMRDSRFHSGVSHTSRVSALIDMYAERDRQREAKRQQRSSIPSAPPQSQTPVRLSKFGFADGTHGDSPEQSVYSHESIA